MFECKNKDLETAVLHIISKTDLSKNDVAIQDHKQGGFETVKITYKPTGLSKLYKFYPSMPFQPYSFIEMSDDLSIKERREKIFGI